MPPDLYILTMMFRLISLNGDIVLKYALLHTEIRADMLKLIKGYTMLSRELVPEQFQCKILPFTRRAI